MFDTAPIGCRLHLIFLLSSTDRNYAVKDVFEGAAYEFRVSAINLSGAGDPSIPCDTVIARDPMSKLITLNCNTVVCPKSF